MLPRYRVLNSADFEPPLNGPMIQQPESLAKIYQILLMLTFTSPSQDKRELVCGFSTVFNA